MKLDLRIDHLTFRAPWVDEDADLTADLFTKPDLKASLSKPKGKAAPMGTRRRMTPVSKMVIDAALNDEFPVDEMDYGVFSSRHGEATQKATLAENVLYREPISPTIFSQSVHNTSAGLFSIFRKCRKPTTSIAAGKQTLSTALLESHAYLADHPNAKVMVVAFDEMLQPALNIDKDCGETSATYALAMMVSRDNPNLSVQLNAEGEANDFELPETLQFLRWWLASPTDSLVTPGQNSLVAWQAV
ncbi:beta-ketoacyl synthase chain length factor [Salinibius halmophilus]|uniref:beta-ketoacyl synthase chain length factor n=1 Tax=Salinibius halmophilus TaxID=1853216 RepID=UPI000E675000|nr:beta-ketoacyl synthase chain length factor [Salinibius halmophilus]